MHQIWPETSFGGSVSCFEVNDLTLHAKAVARFVLQEKQLNVARIHLTSNGAGRICGLRTSRPNARQ